MKYTLAKFLGKTLGLVGLVFVFSATSASAEGMAGVGEKISDFSAKVTSVNYMEGKNVLTMESDGDIGKYGTVGASATFMAPVDAKGMVGPYTGRGMSFRPDGTTVSFTSNGVWKSLGGHRWQVNTIGLGTDGGRTLAVGILELKTMTFKGSIYNLN